MSEPAAAAGQIRSPSGRYMHNSEVLGVGASKTVYKAFDVEKGLNVAWNDLSLRGRAGTSGDASLGKEVQLLKKLDHPNVLKTMDAWVHNETLTFITELMPGGTLRQLIKKIGPKQKISLKAVRGWCSQILLALDYLHSQGIVHRDLKCDNLFVDSGSGKITVGDLGLAKVLDEGDQTATTFVGTPTHMAPEFFDEAGVPYDQKIDIWAFGMTMIEIVARQYPYAELQNKGQIFNKVANWELPETQIAMLPPAVKAVVDRCLVPRQFRPSARELLQEPFFTGGSGLTTSASHVLSDEDADSEVGDSPDAPIADVTTVNTGMSRKGSAAMSSPGSSPPMSAPNSEVSSPNTSAPPSPRSPPPGARLRSSSTTISSSTSSSSSDGEGDEHRRSSRSVSLADLNAVLEFEFVLHHHDTTDRISFEFHALKDDARTDAAQLVEALGLDVAPEGIADEIQRTVDWFKERRFDESYRHGVDNVVVVEIFASADERLEAPTRADLHDSEFLHASHPASPVPSHLGVDGETEPEEVVTSKSPFNKLWEGGKLKGFQVRRAAETPVKVQMLVRGPSPQKHARNFSLTNYNSMVDEMLDQFVGSEQQQQHQQQQQQPPQPPASAGARVPNARKRLSLHEAVEAPRSHGPLTYDENVQNMSSSMPSSHYQPDMTTMMLLADDDTDDN